MKLHDSSSTGASARGGRGRRVASSLSEINVVPLVDVMLVLLIDLHGDRADDDSARHRGQPSGGTALQRSPSRPNELEVTILSTYRQDHKVYLGTELIRTEVVQERVRQKMELAAQKDVNLRGDRSVNLGELTEVTDLLKAAGVEHVGFVTKPPDR